MVKKTSSKGKTKSGRRIPSGAVMMEACDAVDVPECTAENCSIVARGVARDKLHDHEIEFLGPYCRRAVSLLQSWMTEAGYSKLKLAHDLRCGWPHVAKILSGRTVPSLDQAILLKEITGGKVTLTSWKADPERAASMRLARAIRDRA